MWWWINLFVTHFLLAFLPTKTNLFTQRNTHLVGDFGSILDLTLHYWGSQVSSKPQLSLICLAISPPLSLHITSYGGEGCCSQTPWPFPFTCTLVACARSSVIEMIQKSKPTKKQWGMCSFNDFGCLPFLIIYTHPMSGKGWYNASKVLNLFHFY